MCLLPLQLRSSPKERGCLFSISRLFSSSWPPVVGLLLFCWTESKKNTMERRNAKQSACLALWWFGTNSSFSQGEHDGLLASLVFWASNVTDKRMRQQFRGNSGEGKDWKRPAVMWRSNQRLQPTLTYVFQKKSQWCKKKSECARPEVHSHYSHLPTAGKLFPESSS